MTSQIGYALHSSGGPVLETKKTCMPQPCPSPDLSGSICLSCLYTSLLSVSQSSQTQHIPSSTHYLLRHTPPAVPPCSPSSKVKPETLRIFLAGLLTPHILFIITYSISHLKPLRSCVRSPSLPLPRSRVSCNYGTVPKTGFQSPRQRQSQSQRQTIVS